MTTVKQPNSRRNLDRAINRLAQSELDAHRTRIIMANTIVGQMLPSGVVKGGSALKLRYGNSATRFTRDLDTARSEDLEDFLGKLRVRLRQGWNDFTGSVVKRNPAIPAGVPSEYVMQPFEIKLSYNIKSWLTIPLEIGHNEIGDADEPEYEISEDIVTLFTTLGFPEPSPIALMPLSHQIAQKLHGLSESNSNRVHDLIDLQVMIHKSNIDYRKTKEVCERLFAYRRQQTWPPIIEKGIEWDDLYLNQAGDLPVDSIIDDAIVWANKLIAQIDSIR
jgi:hypothetical protein